MGSVDQWEWMMYPWDQKHPLMEIEDLQKNNEQVAFVGSGVETPS